MIWRYDPIILNDTLDVPYHKSQFERMYEKMSPFTEKVTISFVDMYAKLKTPLIRSITDDEMAELSEFIGKTAKSYGLTAVACSEKTDLSPFGIAKSSCIDKATIERICGTSLNLQPDKNQRTGCGCMNCCVYCYANDSRATTERRYRSHDPQSELLVGTVSEGEKITDRKAQTDRQDQICLY